MYLYIYIYIQYNIQGISFLLQTPIEEFEGGQLQRLSTPRSEDKMEPHLEHSITKRSKRNALNGKKSYYIKAANKIKGLYA